jgi:hypothetical protein
MKKLGKSIVTVIIDEHGEDELLRRLSNPFWFQSFGCVLGYDWHSSGVTTVLTGALREVLNPREFNLAVAGGKGRKSRKALDDIQQCGVKFDLSLDEIASLKYASRMSAKVDNTAIQSGYQLYHHAFFMTKSGKWAVIQQGMDPRSQTARRYHWLSEHVKSFVNEPHDAIVCDVQRELALDMTSSESEEARKVSVDLAKEGVKRIKRDLLSLRPKHQRALTEWLGSVRDRDYAVEILKMPRNVNWKALKQAYEFQPRNYEELLSMRGVGPATVRALALVAEIIYGFPPSWKDPVKYSFAFGGKDGFPYPVDKKSMDEAIAFLEASIDQARLDARERRAALKRLRSLSRF